MITAVVPNLENIPNDMHQPGIGIAGFQRYYKRIARRRGWADESPRDTMLLLTEEMGELARAIRKIQGLKRDGGYDDVGLLDELADVQIYLAHLANTLDADLGYAVSQKEHRNQQRFEASN